MSDSIRKILNTSQTPILEDGTATFVWKGRTAPFLVGDFTGWDDEAHVVMEKGEPGIWIYRLPFEPDAYIEYSFLKDGENQVDPFNPRRSPNGIGGTNNYFNMPDYQPSRLNRRQSKVPHGTLSTHSLSTDFFIAGKHRSVHLYAPPVSEPVPLLVVWDGQDYLQRMHLNIIIDNLIDEGRIQPVALALIDNAGQDLRSLEYACSDASLAFLKFEVLPYVKKELNLVNLEQNPGAYGVLGASMGGLMALYTGLRMPEVFGKVLSQSGAFSLGEFDMVVFELAEHENVKPLKIWMDVGIYDLAGLLEANRRMRDLLTRRGYAFIYREYHAGHNYPAWKDDIWRGLEALFSA